MAVTFPLLGRLRSPWRATAVVQCTAVLLATPVLDRLWKRGGSARPGSRRPGRALASGATRRAVAVVAVAVSIGVGALGPGSLYAMPPSARAASSEAGRWLAATHDDGAVVVLPFAPGPDAADFQPTTLAMLVALDDGHPLVNGYSGFFPRDHADLRRALADFPDDASLAALDEHDTAYAPVDAAWLEPRLGELATAGISIIVDAPTGVLLRLPEPAEMG